MLRLAFLDHFDSFTYNVIALLEASKQEVHVEVFSPLMPLQAINDFDPQVVVIGPGPGSPQDYPLIHAVLRSRQDVPTLGICLGMQAINEFYGGMTVRGIPTHGKLSPLQFYSNPLFDGLPQGFEVMRYHSLKIQPASSVEVLAFTDDCPMAIQVKDKPTYAFQFHPESFASEYGMQLMQNFWRIVDAK